MNAARSVGLRPLPIRIHFGQGHLPHLLAVLGAFAFEEFSVERGVKKRRATKPQLSGGEGALRVNALCATVQQRTPKRYGPIPTHDRRRS